MNKSKYLEELDDVDFVDDDEEDILDDNINEEVESEDDFDEENRIKMKDAYDRYIIKLNQELEATKILSEQPKLNNNLQNSKVEKNKVKKNNVLSLDKFIGDIKNKENANKPKKFISKRVEEKLKSQNISICQYKKREFNPRKPPFNLIIIEEKKSQVIDENDFPSL